MKEEGRGREGKGTYSFIPPPTYSHEKINEPRNAPMKIQMMMYPLKYIASSMTKYATANCSICSSARMSCSKRLGRTRTACDRELSTAAGVVPLVAVAVAMVVFCVPDCSLSLPVPLPLPSPLTMPLSDDGDGTCSGGVRHWAFIWARWTMKASYSRATRRRNSRMMTRQMTPMQEPANMPRDRMCQLLATKPGLLVYSIQR